MGLERLEKIEPSVAGGFFRKLQSCPQRIVLESDLSEAQFVGLSHNAETILWGLQMFLGSH